MVFCLIFFVLTLAVAFIHYVQGLMSATISLILIALAACVAFAYYEPLAAMMASKFPDEADSLALCVIFAATYIVPRLLFDAAIPGNIRFPVLVDKIGAGVMGLIAGLISVGVLAIAAQSLPFDGSVGMFTRYETTSKKGEFMGDQNRMQDISVDGLMASDDFNPSKRAHLWLYQDDLALALVSHVSDNGSLAGDRAFAAIHPDYLQELYGQRIGIQGGAKHTLNNQTDTAAFRITGVYTQPKLTQIEGDIKQLKLRDNPLSATLAPSDGDKILLIVGVNVNDFKSAADDGDSRFRFSMGSMRLCVGKSNDQGAMFTDFHPVALLDGKGVAVGYRVDDFIFAEGGSASLYFVFEVDKEKALGSSDPGKLPWKMEKGSFVEFKRYGYADLSDATVNFGPPAGTGSTGLVLKDEVRTTLDKTQPAEQLKMAGQQYSGASTKPQ